MATIITLTVPSPQGDYTVRVERETGEGWASGSILASCVDEPGLASKDRLAVYVTRPGASLPITVEHTDDIQIDTPFREAAIAYSLAGKAVAYVGTWVEDDIIKAAKSQDDSDVP